MNDKELICENCGENTESNIFDCDGCSNALCDICVNICRNCASNLCDSCYQDHKKNCN